MNTKLVIPTAVLLLAGCAGTGPRPAAPAPDAAATPTPAPNAGFPSTPDERLEQQKRKEKVEELASVLMGRRNDTAATGETGEGEIVVDPKTGQRQQRIEKGASGYLASGGRLYATFIRDRKGNAILREDEKAWYVEAPAIRVLRSKSEQESLGALPSRNLPMPLEEAEVVTPKRTMEKLVLSEMSEGLPTEGMWRENFAMADLDGDGRPEIVSPTPRLSGRKIQIFKREGTRWVQPPVTFDDPENIGFEYGGVTCGDMDGDGRVDIVYGMHGGGPAIAYNKGNYHFLVESRGIPREMSTRALAVGDLDGDGHPDIMAVSDIPEAIDLHRAEIEGDLTARLPRADGYVPGIDARAFLFRDGRYLEIHSGLEQACYGYSIALFAPASDGLAPFFASGCRYNGDALVVFTYDKEAHKFTPFPRDVGELYALHVGTAGGVYQGHPAAVVSYSKATPQGGTPNISGYGVSVYYRDGAKWLRKRVLKVVKEAVLSQGLAMGDLNGDGLDDIVFADEAESRVRVLLQRQDGSFEEIAPELEPTFVNHPTAIRLSDVDGDGRLEVVMSYQTLTPDPTRAGGFRVFRVEK